MNKIILYVEEEDVDLQNGQEIRQIKAFFKNKLNIIIKKIVCCDEFETNYKRDDISE